MTDGELIPSKAEKKKLTLIFNRIGTALIAHYLLMSVIAKLGFFVLTPFIKAEYDADGCRIIGFAESAVMFCAPAVTSLLVYFLYYRLYKDKAAPVFYQEEISADDLINTMGLCMLVHRFTSIVIVFIYMGLAEFGYGTPSVDFVVSRDLPTQLLNILTSIILAPIAEELIFRGILLSEAARINERFAIVFSAVMFGLMHGNPYQFASAAIIGLVLGYSVIKTGSLFPAIVGHITVNFMASVPDIVGLFSEALVEYADIAAGLTELVAGVILTIAVIKNKWVKIPPYTKYDKKRTLPVMVKSVTLMIIIVVYVLDIIKTVEPIEKAEEFTETAARIFLT
ncbi:MAG: CPBP family intramembrane metalloprotease [Oscillospiraceae bacterium]|nr:CPBP family intramembrane metalloprotease [Oscillospiraceae bacterium]